MTNRVVSPAIGRVWALLVAVLALSGFAQMPVFKRYYIADVPGLGWTADFYFTHKMHYVAVALLLALGAWLATRWLAQASRNWRLTGSGWLRIVILAGIIITGAFRIYKNQPGASFSPEFTMVVDWMHLGLVMLLGLAAAAVRLAGRGRYTARRQSL